jgi:hypothetical protein
MTKQFKTVSEFKKILAVGDRLHCIHHMDFAGRDAEMKPIWKDKDMGIREVSIKQTNSFALKTTRTDGKVTDSWCSYPKASMARVENNCLIILEHDARQFKGGYAHESNPEYAALPLIPVLTYKFV